MAASIASYLIPEWADQSAVLIAWPHADSDFGPWLTEVESTYIAIASAIAEREGLIIACRDERHRERIAARIGDALRETSSIRWVYVPYDDVWVRDTAPLTVSRDNRGVLLDFRFNAWGNKYAHDRDAAFAAHLCATGIFRETPVEHIDFVLEGGSIESDGAGTLMTTTRCLLNPNRNPHLARDQIEGILRARLGAERILWVEHGHAVGDDTDAHIDTLARFCGEDTIAYTACDRPGDPLFQEFKAMEDQLAGFRTRDGNPYRLVPLPIPAPVRDEQGNRLPATYANFLIINGAVLVPQYDDPLDALALNRLQECFPDRLSIGVPCLPLVRQFGSLHCMTMQFPRTIEVARAP